MAASSSSTELTTTNVCSQCGTPIKRNSSTKMCFKCWQSEFDITAFIPKIINIEYCPYCDTYKHPPSWVETKLQTNELLSFLVNNLKGFNNNLRLLHSEFIWTNQPHPKRIKVKLIVQKENLNGSTIEQACTVEYLMHQDMCGTCLRAHVNPDEWLGKVRLSCKAPQVIDIKQLIADHGPIKVKQVEKTVIEFFFNKRSDAHALELHLCSTFLTRIINQESFMSKVIKENPIVSYDVVCAHKYVVWIEICPVSHGDLICLPLKLSASMGGLGPLVICNRVNRLGIELLDPVTFRSEYLDVEEYWGSPFEAKLRSKELVEYVVLEVGDASYVMGSRNMVADTRVARVSDYGKNDTVFVVRTHLWHMLCRGEHMFGYDLIGAGVVDSTLDMYRGYGVPHVVLVKRSCRKKSKHDKSDSINSK